MTTAENPTFEPNPSDIRALGRATRWSIGVHVGVVLVFFLVPRAWLTKPPRPLMTITLGGTPGPRSTGMTSIGGRTVEQVAPPPKRPEPVPQTTKNESDVVPAKTPTPPPKPAPTAKPQPPAARPVTTGPQVTSGSTRVDTGAKGQGAGLTFGGGGTGGEMKVMEFCCPEYLQELTARIDARWVKSQPEKGTTELKFTIMKDGQIRDVQVTKPSGSGILDRASRSALIDLRLPALPAAYPSDTLTVNIQFPYEGH